MSCGLFQLWVVSDDPDEFRQAEQHAARCVECAEILAGQELLRRAVEGWRQQTEAPAVLEERVRAAVSRSARAPDLPDEQVPPESHAGRRSLLWWALAASFLLGIGLGALQMPKGQVGPQETRRLLAESDLEIAVAEERAQLETISHLEERVAPILAGTYDKTLAGHQAGRLLEYRSRIATLDVTIEDVRGFVERNPGHPRARTLLLDAYKEKKQILRDVLALEERSS